MPLPRGGRPGGVLVAAPRRDRRDRRSAEGSLPADGVGRRGRGRPPGRLSRRGPRLRRGLLRHRPARGRRDGSPAAPAARGGLGGARGGRHRPVGARGDRDRDLRRDQQPRLRDDRGLPTGLGPRGARRDRRSLQRRVRPSLVRPGHDRTERVDRHRVLELARGPAPGLPQPSRRGVRARSRGGREPDPFAAGHDQGGARRNAGERWPLQDVRRGRGRVRARRGLRPGRSQAPLRRAGRRRPRARPDPRHRGQSGWPERRAHRPERRRPAGPDPAGADRRRGRPARGGVRRGARHRHRAGRSDRGQRARRGPGRRPVLGSEAAARLGEDEHRPPRGGGGDRRADQDHPRAPARGDPGAPAPADAEPAHRVGGAAGGGGDRAAAVAGGPAARGA